MDQSELRDLEHLCIQEEWAYCRAACPLHVDARSFCQALANGDVPKARAVLEKTMPVAGILALICEAPCQANCKRNEAGGAIRIGALERFCVNQVPRRGRPLKVPDRGRKATVLGCGLSGLTAAHDLARKGYRVTVYYPDSYPDPETALTNCLPAFVPKAILAAELDFLRKTGISFVPGTCDAGQLSDLLEKGLCVYAGLDAVAAKILPCDPEIRDPVTLAAPESGLFVGGICEDLKPVTAVEAACQGRKAAVSMDRYTQNVSLYADRGREGPVATRLITPLDDVKPKAPVFSDDSLQDDMDLAQKEAGRCLACQCMICVDNCVYLKAFGGYPRSYVRQIYNNEAIVQGTRQANPLINSCMLCGLCTTLCPNDFPMADLCLGARQRMVEKDKMPPSVHDFALKDLAFSRSDAFFLVSGSPGKKQQDCQWLFFPGCQLCATRPGQVAAIYNRLSQNLDGNVGLALACCGAPAHWSGHKQIFDDTASQLLDNTSQLGNPRWIVACPSCQTTLANMKPDLEQVSLWEILKHETDRQNLPQTSEKGMCLVDPCSAARLPAVRQSVRTLLAEIKGLEISQPALNESLAACCGFGGLLSCADPDLGNKAAQNRVKQCRAPALTYCAMCREQIARTGHRAAHLLDFIFPENTDPFARPPTGLSESRKNRRWLKNHILKHYHGQGKIPAPDYLSIDLQMSEKTGKKLEQQRILDSDIQQVIAGAETKGQVFFDPDSKKILASLRLGDVTFWVCYSQEPENSYLIHTAYSHRMAVGKIRSKD